MRFDIITIFPELFEPFLKESLIEKGIQKDLIEIRVHNLRDFTSDRHQTVDDKPYGGGRGMVLKVGPILRCVQQISGNRYQVTGKKPKTLIVLFSPRGKKFDQKKALEFSKLDQLIMICGRYEGVDERVADFIADRTISIGNYVLMGGEVPALAVIETVSRLVPGVVGKSELLKERVTSEKGFLTYPQYTRPKVFSPKQGVEWKVPEVLLSGHHQKIKEWRRKHSKVVGKG